MTGWRVRSFACFTVLVLAAGCVGGSSGTDASGDVAADTTGDGVADAADDAVAEDGAAEVACADDSDCDDGLWCNGEETCGDAGECVEGTAVECDDADPCTSDECDEASAACVNDPLDADEDGFAASTGPDGEACPGNDCDDGDAETYPGAEEGCELVDRDCDGDAEEVIDDDGDGWIDDGCTGLMSDPGDHEGFEDCDDEAEDVYPGAPEGCDGTIDNDCDGDAAEVDTDGDGDGFAPESCGGTDCDDADADVHPDAEEMCDDVDQDCDGDVLDAPGADDDSDTVLDQTCGGTDCDDANGEVHGEWGGVAAAEEICDAVDNDCDGDVLDAPGADDDSDTVLDQTCGGTDCNDANPAVHPGGVEDACDNIDNDCDGDDIDGIADDDDDDFMDAACVGGDDCDDEDGTVHPGATEVCDRVDDDCDGDVLDAPDADDDGDGFLDQDCGGDDCDDEDGSINPWAWDFGCDPVDRDCDGDPLEGMADDDDDDFMDVACGGGDDCDDEDGTVHPGATEVCDRVDDDCDGDVLDAPGADDDTDGYLDGSCGGGDCDDLDDTVHPGADEVCADGVDQDCDGLVDGPVQVGGEVRLTFTPVAGTNTPDVAWSGSEYGVVWSAVADGHWELSMVRLDGEGAQIGSEIPVTTPDGYTSSLARMLWTGSEYGLVWKDERESDQRNLYMSRLAADGTKLLADTRVNDGTYSIRNTEYDVVWAGSVYAGAWVDGRGSSYDVIVALVDSEGNKVLSDLNVSQSGEESRRPELGWSGSHLAVTWSEPVSGIWNVHIRMLDSSGTFLSSAVQLTDVTIDAGPQAVAWAGSEFGVAWMHGGATNEDLWFIPVQPDGSFVPPHVPISSDSDFPYGPDLVYDDGVFSLVWQEREAGAHAVSFKGFDESGASFGSDIALSHGTSGASQRPRITWSGSEFGVVWEDSRYGLDEVFFTRVGLCD
jgi:hypothetical protein